MNDDNSGRDLNGSVMRTDRDADWDTHRLSEDDVTFYIQSTSEYDQMLARAQQSVLNTRTEDQTNGRICGPTGCGKTTLCETVAFDVSIVLEFANTHGLNLHQMDRDELALFHHVGTTGLPGGDSECPECGSGRFYARKTKAPTYRCPDEGCKAEFDTPAGTTTGCKDPETVATVFDDFEDVSDAIDEYNIDHPASRGQAYRDLYRSLIGDRIQSVPLFEVSMSHATNPADLLGHPNIQPDGSTLWEDGTVTKAVRASQDQPVVLVLDEINRSPTSVKDELYDALDGRAQVTLDGERGGETIRGNPSNLIVLSAMNEGSGHIVEPLDFAEKRRLGAVYDVDFLGMEHPDMASELITDNTPASENLSEHLVSCANDIRETAREDRTEVSYGVPTGSLLDWAQQAHANHIAGINNPVIKAGQSTIARAIYKPNAAEVSEVEKIISKNMEGIGFDSADDDTYSRANMYVCIDPFSEGCTWQSPIDEAPEIAHKRNQCPKCDGRLDKQL